jgi:transcriptional regulator with XRE-family HTH domain
MFDKIKKAGLSVDEFATIIGVSRIAVFNWKAGRTSPHKQLKQKVARAIDFVSKLTELKKLPLKDDLSKEERKAKIARLREAFDKYAA